ncbi:MAG: hypothetical protein CVU35_07475 [Betaproteobacteria bacterium HGW-Betaproteobacteria-8]|nr:MAG: hypothetical protein CVU35_07475 [Betaproteobacteria bacterium HGW-Betaproteobacteria-8]
MPANTWTPNALSSEARPWQGSGWRAVEAQHKVSTMALALGDLNDQSTLESILEEVKPLLPTEAEGLHWLLSTPFRYFPLPGGSRFRKRDEPGVFYGADDRQTACAEVGFWRWNFWMASEGLRNKAKSVQLTLFEFHAGTRQAIDLSRPPLSADRNLWVNPASYDATQALALNARKAGIELIRYESVRNPGGMCLAILTPQMFKNVRDPYRNNQQTWTLHIQPPNRITWQRELNNESFSFEFK